QSSEPLRALASGSSWEEYRTLLTGSRACMSGGGRLRRAKQARPVFLRLPASSFPAAASNLRCFLTSFIQLTISSGCVVVTHHNAQLFLDRDPRPAVRHRVRSLPQGPISKRLGVPPRGGGCDGTP
ncbi:unnamed protein product, partial [Gadus morhua 'NCC']